MQLQRTAGNRALTKLILESGFRQAGLPIQRQLSKVVLSRRYIPPWVASELEDLNEAIAIYNDAHSREALIRVIQAAKALIDVTGPSTDLSVLYDQLKVEVARYKKTAPPTTTTTTTTTTPPGTPWSRGEKRNDDTRPDSSSNLLIGDKKKEEKETEHRPRRERKFGRGFNTIEQLWEWKNRGLTPHSGDEGFFRLLFSHPEIIFDLPSHGLDGVIYNLYSGLGGESKLPKKKLWHGVCSEFWGKLKGLGFFLQYEGKLVDEIDVTSMNAVDLKRLGTDFCYRPVNQENAGAVRVYVNVDVKVIKEVSVWLIKMTDHIRDFKLAGPLSGGRSDGLVVWCPSTESARFVTRMVTRAHETYGGTIGASRPAMTGSIGDSSGIGVGHEPLSEGLATGMRSVPIKGYGDESQSFGTVRSEVLARAVGLFRGCVHFASTLDLSPEDLFLLIAAGMFDETGLTGGAGGKDFARKEK